MKLALYVVAPWFATLLYWSMVASCLQAPLEIEPAARVVVAWDPRGCGPPHRVAVELEDDDGARSSGSVPCVLGGLSLDVPQLGIYRGRAYAWVAGEPARSITSIHLVVDEPVVRWLIETPR